MIQEFVDRFMASEDAVKAKFAATHPDSYEDIVKLVVETITDPDKYGDLDPEHIHKIDDGDYQGTLLFVIAAKGYQPHDYWYVKVDYGSCSGCDTLEGIRGYSSDTPTVQEVDDYWTLALHIVQRLKAMDGEAA